jgi:hypothetical protein
MPRAPGSHDRLHAVYLSELRGLVPILLRLRCFEKPIDVNMCLSARREARKRGIDLTRIFFRSLRQSRGRVYFVGKWGASELLVCLEHPAISKGSLAAVFTEARRRQIRTADATVVKAYVASFTSENLRTLLEEEFPDLLPKNMTTTPRLGLGVRMLFTLPALLQGIEIVNCLADFQLSAGREFSVTEVVEATPGRYPEWLGHTGLDAATLYGTIAKECFKFGRSTYGTEIDHAIVSPEPSGAITRIRGHDSRSGSHLACADEARLEDSMEYNRRIIDEATGTGFVVGITTDTSALFREEVDEAASWAKERLRIEYEAAVPLGERETLAAYYHPGVPHAIVDPPSGSTFHLTFTEEELMRLTVKFRQSLLVNKMLREHMAAMMRGRSFTFEPSLDEAYKSLTTEKELFFYLAESERLGMKADLIAPNVGFRKREDYNGDLGRLEERVRKLAGVASRFDAILDFHSGSDKRVEVYQTISRACSGRLKLKMSGVYQLLYFETLAGFGRGTEERKLFERIWGYTLHYAEKEALEGDDTARRMVPEVRNRIQTARKRGRMFSRSPKDDFFRYYSFITVAARNKRGRHIFRNELYRLAEKPRVARKYGRKVVELTAKVAKALGLEQTGQTYLRTLV